MLVVILLAAYNGEQYLTEQLDSIMRQSYTRWRLIVKDDGSTDGSVDLLRCYCERFPEKIQFLGSNQVNRGACRMFSDLLEYVLDNETELELDDYCIAFCDQDDIWHRDKLSKSITYLQTHAREHTLKPLLVHSELTVVDKRGVMIAPCFSAYQGFDPARNDFVEVLLHNVATGCATTITPALARACVPVPQAAYMHDWWVAIVASLIGQIYYIDQPLVDYRQHGGNTLGARKRHAHSKLEVLRGFVEPDTDQALKQVAAQARWVARNPPRRLTPMQLCACWLAGRVLPINSMLLRAMVFKLLAHLSRLRRRCSQQSF